MKLCIAGSRTLFPTPDDIEAEVCKIEKIMGRIVTALINGGAKGVDTQALLWLEVHRPKVHLVSHLPAYVRYGRHAPLMRNIAMGSESDAVLAFWDGKSTGTRHMVESVARNMFKIPTFVVKR